MAEAQGAGPPQPPEAAPADFWQARVRVVLVQPGNSLNIGGVARAMGNLGFGDLRLVAPPRFDLRQAERAACWAAQAVRLAPHEASLEGALADAQLVAGFTARHGRNRTTHRTLAEWVQKLAQQPPARVALVFGSEDHGLSRQQLEYCHTLVRIPSATQNPSFNLAQAVLLALFALCEQARSQAASAAAGTTAGTGRPTGDAQLEGSTGAPQAASRPEGQLHTPRRAPRAPMAQYAQLDRLVEETLHSSGFLHRGSPAPAQGMIRRMMRRMEPDAREMGLLLGLFGRISRTLRGTVPPRLPAAGGGSRGRQE